jgi:Lon protease-like protein
VNADEAPAAGTTIPIFPLSTVVLFPGADCPLHIFEPRYRQMTRFALDGAGWVGMVMVRPEHVGEMAGDPPVFPIGSLGRIRHSEELPDGRLNIVLHGVARFRIRDEPPRSGDQLYRTAVVDPLEEVAAVAEDVARLRERISESFGRLVSIVAPERSEQLGPERLAPLDDASFLSALVQLLNLPPVERQGLLETNGVGDRLGALESILRFQLVGLGLGTSGDPERVH